MSGSRDKVAVCTKHLKVWLSGSESFLHVHSIVARRKVEARVFVISMSFIEFFSLPRICVEHCLRSAACLRFSLYGSQKIRPNAFSSQDIVNPQSPKL